MLRRGPSSEASTLRTLGLCPLPPRPRVADLGCGSGSSALLLARSLQVPVLAHFRLPPQDWWDYFEAVERQCAFHEHAPGLEAVLRAQRDQIENYRQTGHSYGYTFYILRKP